MKNRCTIFLFLVCALLLVVNSCKVDESLEPDLVINLRTMQDYNTQSWNNIETGLLWSLSSLGAQLPVGSLHKTVVQQGNLVVLNLNQAGFSTQAEYYLGHIITQLKQSEEYKRFNAVDAGRFLMLTLYSPYHYYAITGAETTLAEFEQKHLQGSQLRFAVNNSNLTPTERLVRFVPPVSGNKIAFVAEDGTGSIANNTFSTMGTECWTIMPNGQLRFAIYSKDGRLKDASNAHAGKPGKCMWCHEIVVQRLFTVMTDVPGYLTTSQFAGWVDTCQAMLNEYRNTLQGEIDFSKRQDHTYAELLYLAFMEPPLQRLAQEWEMSDTDVLQHINSLSTHQNGEFPFGDLYHRRELEQFSPFNTVPVPHYVRQQSAYEPDLFSLSP